MIVWRDGEKAKISGLRETAETQAEAIREAARADAARLTAEAAQRAADALAAKRRADDREEELRAQEEALEVERERIRAAVALVDRVGTKAAELSELLDGLASVTDRDPLRQKYLDRSQAVSQRAARLQRAAKPLSQVLAEREALEDGSPDAGAPGLRSELG